MCWCSQKQWNNCWRRSTKSFRCWSRETLSANHPSVQSSPRAFTIWAMSSAMQAYSRSTTSWIAFSSGVFPAQLVSWLSASACAPITKIWYRVFYICYRLYKLSKVTGIQWSLQLQTNFDVLKQRLFIRPIVRLLNFKLDFIIETDASLIAVWAVFKQYLETQNWNTRCPFLVVPLQHLKKLQCIRVGNVCCGTSSKHFRVYLLGRAFLLRSENAALVNFLKPDLSPDHTSTKVYFAAVGVYALDRIQDRKRQYNRKFALLNAVHVSHFCT